MLEADEDWVCLALEYEGHVDISHSLKLGGTGIIEFFSNSI